MINLQMMHDNNESPSLTVTESKPQNTREKQR